MSSKPSVRPHQFTLLAAGIMTVIGSVVPFVRQLLLPVMYLNTHLHELSHAVIAKITGGNVLKIIVSADGSGQTPVMGGNLILIASAGYVGASLIGAFMIAMGGTEKTAQRSLAGVAVALGLSLLVWVRGDTVGLVAGFGWILVLGAMVFFLRGKALMFCCQFLGLEQCLNSLQSLFALVKISVATETQSDASLLQNMTGIPSLVFALFWSTLSVALVVWTVRKSWQPIPIQAER